MLSDRWYSKKVSRAVIASTHEVVERMPNPEYSTAATRRKPANSLQRVHVYRQLADDSHLGRPSRPGHLAGHLPLRTPPARRAAAPGADGLGGVVAGSVWTRPQHATCRFRIFRILLLFRLWRRIEEVGNTHRLVACRETGPGSCGVVCRTPTSDNTRGATPPFRVTFDRCEVLPCLPWC